MKLIKWKIRWRREKEDRGNHVPPLWDATQTQGLKWRTEHPRPPTTSSIMQPICWGYPACNPSTTHARISWDFCECHFQGLTPDLQIQILWKMIPRKWHFNKHPQMFLIHPKVWKQLWVLSENAKIKMILHIYLLCGDIIFCKNLKNFLMNNIFIPATLKTRQSHFQN